MVLSHSGLRVQSDSDWPLQHLHWTGDAAHSLVTIARRSAYIHSHIPSRTAQGPALARYHLSRLCTKSGVHVACTFRN